MYGVEVTSGLGRVSLGTTECVCIHPLTLYGVANWLPSYLEGGMWDITKVIHPNLSAERGVSPFVYDNCNYVCSGECSAGPRHAVSGCKARVAAQIGCTRKSLGSDQTRSCTSGIRMTHFHKNTPLPVERLCHTLNTPPTRVLDAQLEANHHTHPVLRISTEISSSQLWMTHGPSFLSPKTRSRTSSRLRLSCTEGASSSISVAI